MLEYKSHNLYYLYSATASLNYQILVSRRLKTTFVHVHSMLIKKKTYSIFWAKPKKALILLSKKRIHCQFFVWHVP